MSGTDDPLINFAGAAEKTAAGSDADDAITDYPLAKRFAAEVLPGRYCWVSGWGWMEHREGRGAERRGPRWFRTTDKEMADRAGEWLLEKYQAFLDDNPDASVTRLKEWKQQLSEFHLKAVASLAAGMEKHNVAEFDAHPTCCVAQTAW